MESNVNLFSALLSSYLCVSSLQQQYNNTNMSFSETIMFYELNDSENNWQGDAKTN